MDQPEFRPVLLVPAFVGSEYAESDITAVAIEVTSERMAQLMGTWDVLAAAREADERVESVSFDAKYFGAWPVQERGGVLADPNGRYGDLVNRLEDLEENLVVDREALGLDLRRAGDGRVVMDVARNYLQFSGYVGGDRWLSSGLWRSSLYFGWLHVAPEPELPDLFERLAHVSPLTAVEVLERGIRPDGPSDFARPAPRVTQAALAAMLRSEDRSVRQRAITLTGRAEAGRLSRRA